MEHRASGMRIQVIRLGTAISPGAAPFVDRANNNVSIAAFRGRLFMAFRTARTHFAGRGTRLLLMSTLMAGVVDCAEGRQSVATLPWSLHLQEAVGADIREPLLIAAADDGLILTYFTAGRNPLRFDPTMTWVRAWPDWQRVEPWDEGSHRRPCVVWDAKVQPGGKHIFVTAYRGNHYGVGRSRIDVELSRIRIEPSGHKSRQQCPHAVHCGGVSEVAIEFDQSGNLWGVGRNEDGDDAGFGCKLLFAPADRLCAWSVVCTMPWRVDSPRMFRVGQRIFVLGRRDVGGCYDGARPELPMPVRKGLHLVAYSLRPKTTSMYMLDCARPALTHVFDLPGNGGDTAYPSVVALGDTSFLVANYESSDDRRDQSWIRSQLASTSITWTLVRFLA